MATTKTIITPSGKAHWVFLSEPFTQFDPEGVYKLELELDKNDDDVQKLIASIEKASKGLKQRPYHVDDDNGNYRVKFASKYKPNLFDAKNNRINADVKVGSGSVVRVAFQPVKYDGFGGGLKLYLKAVQVIELNEYSGGSAEDYGFDAKDGGYTIPDDGFDAVVSDDTVKTEEVGFDW